MNTKKLFIAALTVTTAFTACKKGTISEKRLDGTWDLSSGNGNVIISETYGGQTMTTKINFEWDGKKQKSNSMNDPNITEKTDYSEQLIFSKKDDSFTSKTHSIISYENGSYNYFASKADCDAYLSSGTSNSNITQKTITTTETTINGYFTILDAKGDAEKNTRFLLEPSTFTTLRKVVSEFYNGNTLITNIYRVDNETNSCVLAETASTDPISTSGSIKDIYSIMSREFESFSPAISEATVLTVEESTKKEMTITSKGKFLNSTDKSGTGYGITSDLTKKFTKE